MIVIWVYLDILAAPGPSTSPTPGGGLTGDQFGRVLGVLGLIALCAIVYRLARYGGRSK